MRYRHLLEFGILETEYDENNFPVVDDNGQPVKTFIPFKKAYGNANEVFGQEKYLAKQQYNSEIIKFTIHYISGLRPDMYIKFNGEFYEMVGPPDNVKYLNKELKIEARRVVI